VHVVEQLTTWPGSVCDDVSGAWSTLQEVTLPFLSSELAYLQEASETVATRHGVV